MLAAPILDTALAAIALLLTVVGLMIQTRRRSFDSPERARLRPNVLLLDASDSSVLDVLVLSPQGDDLFPDGRGMLELARGDSGRTFAVLDRSTRRVRCSFRYVRSRDLLRVRVPA